MKKAFVFPGQGSQYVGMGLELAEKFSSVMDLFKKAEDATGIDVRRLCFEGPMEELTKTSNLQVCLSVVDMGSALALEKSDLYPDCTAGHSLGEYPALWAAGVLSTKSTLELVKERGKLMEGAGSSKPGAMAAILGMKKEELQELIAPLSQKGVLALANHNSPEQIVATGEKHLVKELCQAVKKSGKKAIPLKVAGAYHSPLMEEPALEFAEKLRSVEFNRPHIPLYSNVSGKAETDPERIRNLMVRQMTEPVRWVEIVDNMISDGVQAFVETGPKKVLSNLIKKCMGTAEEEGRVICHVQDDESLEKCLETIKNV